MRISDWSSDVCSSDLTESRFANYDRTVGRTLDHNPILGLGVKPREQDNHIAVGSHSTFVSAFTKSGTLGLSLVVAYLVLLPAYRWLGGLGGASRRSHGERAEMRILFNLQVARWVWQIGGGSCRTGVGEDV